jgi:hypothetical protein
MVCPALVQLSMIKKWRLTELDLRRIYRFTELPDGFSHEVVQHNRDHPVRDERTNSNVIDLDNYCCGKSNFRRV